jgi:hypothetical protein
LFNLAEIHRGHERFKADLRRELDAALDEQKLTEEAQAHIKANAAFRSRTGNLVSKTEAKVVKLKNGRVVKLRNKAKYAAALDSGSGLHGPRHSKYIIRARRAKYLRFIGRDGNVVYRKSVLHPGVKPTHFLRTATAVIARKSAERLRAAMARAAEKF